MTSTRVDPTDTSTFPSGFYRLSSPDGSVKCLKSDGSNRYIAGYANVADVLDSQDEVVGISVLNDAWEKWKSNPEFCVLSLLHSNIPLAKVVFDPVTDSDGNIHKSGVDDKGLYLVAKVRSDIKIADDAWTKIQSGELRGFSIGGQNVVPPERECKDGRCFNRLKGIELHEVGIVNRPANRVSLFTVLKNDTLEKLSEITNQVQDSILKEHLVQVSKQPDIEGKYHIYIQGGKDCPVYKMVSDSLLRSNESFTKSIRIVDEMDANVGYVPLFDLALLRPFSVKSDSPLTEGDGTVASTSPPSYEPMVGEPTMNDEKEDVTPNAPTAVPVEVKPEIDEKPIAPLTLETLAADLAQMKEMIKSLMSKMAVAEKNDVPLMEGVIAKSEEKPCGCPEVKKDDPIVSPTAPAQVTTTPTPVVTTPIVEVKVEAPKVEVPAPIIETAPAPTPIPVAKVEPVIVQPAVEVKQVAPATVPTEPVVIQRGKSVPDKASTGIDLESISKMSWRELNRLRG